MTAKPKNATSADHVLMSELTVKTRKGTRRLSKTERDALIQMLAVKAAPQDFDVQALIPRGSFLERIARHFEETDISYALPIMHVVMTAASYLRSLSLFRGGGGGEAPREPGRDLGRALRAGRRLRFVHIE